MPTYKFEVTRKKDKVISYIFAKTLEEAILEVDRRNEKAKNIKFIEEIK